MLFRNLMAMDVEEAIRGNPVDGVVLLCGCDKVQFVTLTSLFFDYNTIFQTTPAQLMGAASVDLPSIMVSGGQFTNRFDVSSASDDTA